VKERGRWDSSFEKASILKYVPSSKQYIIHQVNRPYGLLYFPREFLFARYTYKSYRSYFIIDKSLDDPHLVSKSVKCPRGNIDYGITRITQDKDDVEVSMLIKISNGGLCTSAQDTGITMFALNNFPEIRKVFSRYEEDYQFDLIGLPDTHPKKTSRPSVQEEGNEDLVRRI